MMLLKAPKVFDIQPRQFDPETYVEEEEEEEEEQMVDAAEEDANLKKPSFLPKSVVRWREVQNEDGTFTRESNARFIRWSDGSLQLQIGDEYFDVTEQDIQNENNHLFLRHDEQRIMESQGQIQKKLLVRPSSLSSASHTSLVAQIDSQQLKCPKVKSCPTEIDPEWLMMQEAKKVVLKC
ncbi:protein LEO1 homolog [Mangifera indica]|uniref:protein LEO1 homolog n=1 Tax=Mangifera indica TaxID=29780 RepID=UPI001CFA96F9|nr:protein LEO1 homolog [Mangifera indica]